MTLPVDPKARKDIPVYSGFIKYFPRAICAVAELSRIGNDQHNPGKAIHWDRSKSCDEKDSMMRHMIDDAMDIPVDTDNVLHATKMAWRAMANLEKALEAQCGLNQYKIQADWIKNTLGKNPFELAHHARVDVRLRCGSEHTDGVPASSFKWSLTDHPFDVLEYRTHQS